MVTWTRDLLIGFDGKPLAAPGPVMHLMHYVLSPQEMKLVETLADLFHLLRSARQQGLLTSSLVRSLYSSPAALEARIERINVLKSNQIHLASKVLSMDSEDDESVELQGIAWIVTNAAEKHLA